MAAETTRTAQAQADRNIDRMSQSAHQAVDRAAGAAQQVADRLNEHAERITDKGEELLAMKDDWIETARDYVREKPFAALGMALAAGYLLHMITRSR
ncbi:MAG TPA: hypothetical protein VFB08_13280 [Burkholderiales bacterium]|nr:hypothetical protein [Burkholderiales bacterium]